MAYSSLVGLAGVIALLALSLVNEYQEADKHARREAENISRLLEEHALATVQKVDLLLRDVQGHMRPDDMRLARGANSSRTQELHALLKSHLETVPEASVLYFTNAKGDHVFGSIDPVPRINIADRYNFTHQRDDPAAGLMISPPLISRTTGKWTMTMTRRLNFEDGSFAGVVSIVMNPEYFQQFYRTLNLGKHGLISLYDKELHLAARYPPREQDMGKVANIYAKPDIEKGVKHGTYHAKSPLDGIKRLVSFRQVGDLPLYVFAGIAEDDYLAEPRQHAWRYGIGVAILGLIMMSLGIRQQRSVEALRKSDEDLHTIADYTYDWEYWEGPQRELLYMSPSCERITGYSLSEFKAAPELLYGIIHPDDQHLMEEHRNNIGHSETSSIDFRIVRRDGEVRWISHGCQAVHGKSGQHLGRRANNRDITERKEMEQSLRESEERFRLIGSAANDGIIILGSEDRCVYWSPAAEKIFGYPASEAFSQNMHDLIAPARYRENFRRGFEHFMDSGKGPLVGKSVEIEALRKDGKEVPVELSISALQIKGQWHALGIVRDISDRREKEQALHEANERFRLTFESAAIGMAVVSLDGRFLQVNSALSWILGHTEEELLQKTLQEVTHPDDMAIDQEFIRQILHGERLGYHIEKRLVGIKGNPIWVQLSASVAVDAINHQLSFVIQIQNISERKEAEMALRRSKEIFQATLSSIGESIYLLDRKGTLIAVNPTGAHRLGKEPEELVGTDVFALLPADVAGRRHAIVDEVFRTLEPRTLEDSRNGRAYWSSYYPVVDSEGECEAVVVVANDITERKRMEEDLRQLNTTLDQRVNEEVTKNMEQERMLIQQSRLAAMGEMIGNIAHQWRQPLNALGLLFATIKDAYEYNELDKEYLDTSVGKGQHLIQSMSTTIDDFRNFFKPNKEKQRFQPWNGIEEAIKLVSHSFKNHNIEVELEKCDEPCEVMGYPNEFSQVVLNALSNVKDVMIEKKIRGKVHIRIDKGVDTATISIRDNGGGIPEEVLPKVFDPYFTTKEKGTGIGLYMSKMIMDHMDGDITIRNVEGGAEVLITLPLAGVAV